MGEEPNAAFMRDLYELRRVIEPEARGLCGEARDLGAAR